jgi:hypothetical protein
MRRFWKIAGPMVLVAFMALAAVAVVSADGPQGGRFDPVGDLWERMHEGHLQRCRHHSRPYHSAIETAR